MVSGAGGSISGGGVGASGGGPTTAAVGVNGANGYGSVCGVNNLSTRRRMMAQNCFGEIHELQHLK